MRKVSHFTLIQVHSFKTKQCDGLGTKLASYASRPTRSTNEDIPFGINYRARGNSVQSICFFKVQQRSKEKDVSGAINSPIAIKRWQWLAFITNGKVQLSKIDIHKYSVVLAEAVVCWSPAAIKLTKAWNYGMYASTSPLVSPRFSYGSKHKAHHTKQ